MPNTSFLVNSTENFNSLIPPDDGEVNAPEDENTTPSSILHSGSIKFPGIYSRSAQVIHNSLFFPSRFSINEGPG
jgi:hypothetical protein